MTLPLDNDGFLRRECPNCLREFKWHDGPANAEAEDQAAPDSYFCPFCGQPAVTDHWFTTEQVEYIEARGLSAAIQAIDEELDSAFRGMRSKHVKITKTGSLDAPAEPDPLVEPDDMMIVVSPCHSWEPIKVPEDTTGSLHCLICGQPFAL